MGIQILCGSELMAGKGLLVRGLEGSRVFEGWGKGFIAEVRFLRRA